MTEKKLREVWEKYQSISQEKKLREAWEKYQSTAHPEDMMSYVEFLSAMGIELK